jgi:ribosomal protein L14
LYKGFCRSTAYTGDFVRASVRRKKTTCRVRKGARIHGIIIRTNRYVLKRDGSSFKFFKNNITVLKKRMTPRGPENFGPAPFNIKRRKFINSFAGVIF